MLRTKLAPDRQKPGVVLRIPPLAGSVAGHMVIAGLLALIVAHPAPKPPDPQTVQIVFSPAPDTAPPDLPPPASPTPTQAAAAPSPGPPPPPALADIPVAEPASSAAPPPPKVAPKVTPAPLARPRRPAPPRQTPSAAPGNPAPAPTASPAPAPPPLPSTQEQGEALAAWRKSLATWLNAHRRYPEQARQDGVQGQPIVRFTVAQSGRVTNVELLASSGSTVLDEAAIEMLRGATLPPFPPGLTQAAITASVRVRYALEQ